MISFDDSGHAVIENMPYSRQFQAEFQRSIPGVKWRSMRWYAPDVHIEEVVDLVRRYWPLCPLSEAVEATLAYLPRARAARSADDLPQPLVRATDGWGHQLRGFHFAQHYPAVLLAMGMGTGKTKVAIDLVQNSPVADSGTVLILAPKGVAEGHVWPKEFAKHAAVKHSIITLTKGTVEKRTATLKQHLDPEGRGLRVAVTNYEAFQRMDLKGFHVDWLIADEAHVTKAPAGKTSKALHLFGKRARWKLALTGTPMPHGPMDVYALFRWLDDGLFGTSFTRFKQRYGVFGGYGNYQVVGYQNMDEFERRMDLLTYQADRSHLDLPDVMDEVIEVELEPAAKKIYKDLEKRFIADLSTALEEGGAERTVTVASAMVLGLRLQQLTGGFLRPDDSDTPQRVSGAKALALAELLDGMGPAPAVVFTRFHTDLDTVHEVCRAAGIVSAEVSGRRNDLLSWQDGDSQVLAVQVQSGGVGIDLTRSRYAIYYSLGYSLGDYEQSRARVHRPGQSMPVTNYHLVARGTVDQHVYRALERKQNVIEEILKEVGR